jgi:hypothetical protein
LPTEIVTHGNSALVPSFTPTPRVIDNTLTPPLSIPEADFVAFITDPENVYLAGIVRSPRAILPLQPSTVFLTTTSPRRTGWVASYLSEPTTQVQYLKGSGAIATQTIASSSTVPLSYIGCATYQRNILNQTVASNSYYITPNVLNEGVVLFTDTEQFRRPNNTSGFNLVRERRIYSGTFATLNGLKQISGSDLIDAVGYSWDDPEVPQAAQDTFAEFNIFEQENLTYYFVNMSFYREFFTNHFAGVNCCIYSKRREVGVATNIEKFGIGPASFAGITTFARGWFYNGNMTFGSNLPDPTLGHFLQIAGREPETAINTDIFFFDGARVVSGLPPIGQSGVVTLSDFRFQGNNTITSKTITTKVNNTALPYATERENQTYTFGSVPNTGLDDFVGRPMRIVARDVEGKLIRYEGVSVSIDIENIGPQPISGPRFGFDIEIPNPYFDFSASIGLEGQQPDLLRPLSYSVLVTDSYEIPHDTHHAFLISEEPGLAAVAYTADSLFDIPFLYMGRSDDRPLMIPDTSEEGGSLVFIPTNTLSETEVSDNYLEIWKIASDGTVSQIRNFIEGTAFRAVLDNQDPNPLMHKHPSPSEISTALETP